MSGTRFRGTRSVGEGPSFSSGGHPTWCAAHASQAPSWFLTGGGSGPTSQTHVPASNTGKDCRLKCGACRMRDGMGRRHGPHRRGASGLRRGPPPAPVLHGRVPGTFTQRSSRQEHARKQRCAKALSRVGKKPGQRRRALPCRVRPSRPKPGTAGFRARAADERPSSVGSRCRAW